MSDKNYSGKFVIRVDPAIHKRLVIESRKAGKSLNSLIKAMLEAGLKRNKEKLGSMVS